MESDLSSTLAGIQANCRHDIVDQMLHIQQHYQLRDLKSVEWARNLSCLRRLSRKRRRRGAWSDDDDDEGDWSSNTLGRGTTNGHSDYIAVSYPWKAAAVTALCDPATQRTTASTNVDSTAAGGWKIAVPGNARRVERSKVRDGVLRRAVAYAETHGTELIWIDRECVPQDEDTVAGEVSKEDTHLHETAMQSMDLVYRWSKHPIALIFESVTCQEEVDLLESLLRGGVVEVKGFDGDFTGPPAAGEAERSRGRESSRRGAKSKSKSKSKGKEESSSDVDEDEIAAPLRDHPRFSSSVDTSTISRLLSLLTRLTSDPWFSRAWIFQENYCAGAKMRLLIPHSRHVSKAHAVDLFGSIPHELNIRSIAFFNAATKFCLAYLADPRYVVSTQGKAQCEAIIHRAGRYNLLHRYGFVSETGSTSPTEIALQAEAKEARRRLRRHRRRSGGGHGSEREREMERKLQHASRPFSRAMSTTIFADLAARRLTQPHDILAIAANCCAYDARLDTKALRSAGTVAKAAATFAGAILEGKEGVGGEGREDVAIDEIYQSLSAAVLALWFLNGEVFKNMLPPPPEPQLPSEYPDITISPVGDGQGEIEAAEEPAGSQNYTTANNNSNANRDFDTSDAPLCLTLSTSLSNQSPATSRSPLPPNTSIPPTPVTNLTSLSFLSQTALDSFIPPAPSSPSFRAGPLTFLKSCRFRCVALTRAGVATRGHMWVLDERIATTGWNAPVARGAEGGRFWRRKRNKVDPLALLAGELRTRATTGGGDSGGRYTWLARRVDAMVAVRAEASQAAEEKRERRTAKKMGIRMSSLKSKTNAAAVGNAMGKAVVTAKKQQKVDQATLTRLRESVTTFDRCMADAVAEAIRDGRDLILARLWDGEDPAAVDKGEGEEKENDASAARKKKKKVYRAVFIWDETPQSDSASSSSSSSSEDSDGEEVDERISDEEDTTQNASNSPKEELERADKRGQETKQEATPSVPTPASTTDMDSDTPLCRLPSRTKAKILQSVADDALHASSSSSSLTSLSSASSSSRSSSPPTSTFAPTLAFTSHTPHNTRYRFDRRAALEESHIDKFVCLEVALDAACPAPSQNAQEAVRQGERGDDDDVGDGDDSDDSDAGRKRRRDRSKEQARPARSTSRRSARRQTAATPAASVSKDASPAPGETPAPPILRTKRWINGLAFLPSPPPAPADASSPVVAQKRGPTADRSRKSKRANVKVNIRGKEKAKAHIEATKRRLRVRGLVRDAVRRGKMGRMADEGDGEESWEEEAEAEAEADKSDADDADGDEDEGLDWQTGERRVVFAWPEGLARK